MRYPLLFTYRDTLFGEGFVVEVVTSGRALGVEEPNDAVWIYGVNPGALASCGDSLLEAHANFRREYSRVLHDIAANVHSYEEFKAEAERFFNESNDNYSVWLEATADVRSGAVTAPLPQQPADSPRSIEVSYKTIDAVRPRDNEPEMVNQGLAKAA